MKIFSHKFSTFLLTAVLVAVSFNTANLHAATSAEQTSIEPFIDVQARKNEIASLSSYERSKYCGSRITLIKLSKQAVITGHLQWQESNVQMAGHAIYLLVENYYRGSTFAAEEIREVLAEAVRINAFSDVQPYKPKELPSSYNAYNEPYFQLGAFLGPVAHAYLILKTEYPDDTNLIEAVKNWGDSIYETTVNKKNSFGGKTKGVDRRGLQATGYAHWGNATGNHEILETALKYYKKSMLSVGKRGKDRIWRFWAKKKDHVYYPNMTYQTALASAFILHRSGYDDVFEYAPKKGTIVDGVEWLWDQLFEKKQTKLIRTRSSGTRHLAWSELFISQFPDHPVSEKMRQWRDSQHEPLYGALAGGPTTCLYRKIN